MVARRCSIPARDERKFHPRAEVTEVKAAGDYEAVLTWVVGLRAKVPFRVLVLDGPPRLVIDFQH